MKIIFLSAVDPRDYKSWSGTPKNMLDALNKKASVEIVAPMVSIVKPFLLLISKFLLIFTGKKYNYIHSKILAWEYGLRFTRILRTKKADFIFAIGSTQLAYLKTDIPIIYACDATFLSIVNYYPDFSNLFAFSIEEGMDVERKALTKSRITTFPSKWACQSAINDFNITPAKVKLISWGPNFPEIPVTIKFKESNIKKIKLLFLGVDWQRKGGQIALDAFNYLIHKNIDVELNICGCSPTLEPHPKNINILGRLNKNNKDDLDRLQNLFSESDFLILPTQQECYGMVFCEASAFGLPSLANDTGGVSSVVFDGVNGFLFPNNAGGEYYAEKILEVISDREMLLNLRKSSRHIFETKLNWDEWATQLIATFKQSK